VLAEDGGAQAAAAGSSRLCVGVIMSGRAPVVSKASSNTPSTSRSPWKADASPEPVVIATSLAGSSETCRGGRHRLV
jgi:hypothetical protein